MCARSPRLMQHLAQAWSMVVMLYTSGHRKGWRYILLHCFVCFTVSLAFNALLFVCLYCALKYDLVVSGSIVAVCVVVATAALFFSKRVRCFSILFLIACGMKQGRTLLITAGTGLVVFWNFQNTLRNLTDLARSMLCNLEKKRISIELTPLSNYVKMLKWVGDLLKRFTDFGVVIFTSDFHISSKAESKNLEEKLEQAKRSLNETAEHMLAVMNIVSSVSQKVFPALGFVLLIVFTVLYLRSYYYNRKYENTFITSRFIRYDEKQKAEGKPYVLPLTKKEAKRYITIPSPLPTVREGKAMMKFYIPVLTHLLAWVFFIGVDALLYWLIMIIKRHLEEIEPFHVPMKMSVKTDTSFIGISLEEMKKEQDFSFSVNLFEKECLPEPQLLLHESLIPLSIILLFLVVLGLLSAKLLQLKLLISAQFYGDNADERVAYLHAKILRKRAKTKQTDRKDVLKALVRKPSFWFPVFFRNRKDDKIELT
ncbi:hypothetical protein MATL_G00135840 [Megalops atlanticus]|uniref:Dendritic cell-specific transmembrane protein-like domain-containing protein n=1 Tax=Megalops atlanticus TaxID=7932 RepID=A0A9D3PWB1_MEGAT|nr:hypothetical protein MATL_G00135840 [Megalops atlanticus]